MKLSGYKWAGLNIAHSQNLVIANMSTNCASSLENGMCREKKGCALPMYAVGEERTRAQRDETRQTKSDKGKESHQEYTGPKGQGGDSSHCDIEGVTKSSAEKRTTQRCLCTTSACTERQEKRRARRPPAYIEEPHY